MRMNNHNPTVKWLSTALLAMVFLTVACESDDFKGKHCLGMSSKISCRQATTKNNPFKFRLNWHTPLFSRHGIIKASLTSLTFLTFGKLQASLIFRSLNRKVRFCSWLNENNPMIVTFVLTGRTRVHCTMSPGCYPGLRKPLGFQPAFACFVISSPPLLVWLLTPRMGQHLLSPG